MEDLEESVNIVESSGDRWGLGDEEVRKRRGFVQRVARQVEDVRDKVDRVGKGRKGKEREMGGYRDLPAAERGQVGEDENEQKRWEMEEQQVCCTLPLWHVHHQTFVVVWRVC